MSKFNGEAGAALVFLILYLFIFSWMLFAYFTHRLKWRSRWSFLLFHVTIRVASQGCGIGFGILGFKNLSLFLAFLILGAEGYFSLVLCTFRFIISWHQHNFPSGTSWLEPRREAMKAMSKRDQWRRTLTFLLLGPFALILYPDNAMGAFHLVLVLANTAIIVGGSFLAGANPPTQHALDVSRAARTAGQGVFLACNLLLLVVILATIRQDHRMRAEKGERGTHPTLILLSVAWIPLIVRGIFGVLQAVDYSLSYYNPANYDANGFTPRFTAIEYVLGVMTEWLACALLNATYYTSRHDPKKPTVASAAAAEKEKSERSEAQP
ncbi:hypothetical protein FB45DRAFT_844596 [Roridomyces roridus]|uniref:Uncharacterized protein n=1 Tax=Roridomyces roridus TaxID=1738132 RepID=A0AAD7B4R9_9AGAR|nr:hypothetical protein FB45DRAFT_844596 [Roridomyces roridus]